MYHCEHKQHTGCEACRIFRLLLDLLERMIHMSGSLDSIVAAAKNIEDKGDAAIAALKELAAKIAELEPNQAAIDALAAEVNAKAAEIGEAIATYDPPTAP